MNKEKEVIYAFIDSQNLNLSVRNDIKEKKYKGWVLDFKRFYVYLKDKYKVDRSFLFIGRIDGQERLYMFLESVGYEMVYKPTLINSDGKAKGNVDAELVLHAMIEYPNYDKAIIVSGDGDFHCLIEYLDKMDKLSKIMIPNKASYSSLLRKFHNKMVYVSDLRKKLEYKKDKQKKRE